MITIEEAIKDAKIASLLDDVITIEKEIKAIPVRINSELSNLTKVVQDLSEQISRANNIKNHTWISKIVLVLFVTVLTITTYKLFEYKKNAEFWHEKYDSIRFYGFKCIDSVLFYSYKKNIEILEPVWVNGVSIECDKYGNYLNNGVETEKELIEKNFMSGFFSKKEEFKK